MNSNEEQVLKTLDEKVPEQTLFLRTDADVDIALYLQENRPNDIESLNSFVNIYKQALKQNCLYIRTTEGFKKATNFDPTNKALYVLHPDLKIEKKALFEVDDIEQYNLAKLIIHCSSTDLNTVMIFESYPKCIQEILRKAFQQNVLYRVVNGDAFLYQKKVVINKGDLLTLLNNVDVVIKKIRR